MPLQKIKFITSNRNKLAEVETILGEVVTVQSQSLDLTEIQGTEDEIAKDKCQRAAEIVGTVLLRSLCQTLISDGNPGWRASINRRHMPLLQCSEGATGTIHVDHSITLYWFTIILTFSQQMVPSSHWP